MDLVTIKDKYAKPERNNQGHYVIRDKRDDPMHGIIGRCGNVRVGYTFSTYLWFWQGGFFGYLDRNVEVKG